MTRSNHSMKKILLLLEDEPEVREVMRRPFDRYGKIKIVVKEADDPGKAWDLLFADSAALRPDALILDIMMPYGDASGELDGPSDPSDIETGMRLLRRLREHEEKKGLLPLWTAVVTARSEPDILHELALLLNDYGRIYLKPYNDIELENDMATILGIPSQVPPELLSQGYEPPSPVRGGAQ